MVHTGLTPPKRSRLREVMKEIDFLEDGRYFKHAETKLFIEFPRGPPSVGEEPVGEIIERHEITGILKIISPTDCVKDRLTWYYHDKDRQCLDQAVLVAQDHQIGVQEELQNFVDAGLTPYEAIKAGTHDAAEFFNALDEFGTVTVGRRADLILLEANPLVEVKNTGKRVGVMVRGKWYTESELRSRLEEIVVRYSHESADQAQRVRLRRSPRRLPPNRRSGSRIARIHRW